MQLSKSNSLESKRESHKEWLDRQEKAKQAKPKKKTIAEIIKDKTGQKQPPDYIRKQN